MGRRAIAEKTGRADQLVPLVPCFGRRNVMAGNGTYALETDGGTGGTVGVWD